MRSRASSASIATPVVEGFCNTAEMRLKVLHAHLQTIKEKGYYTIILLHYFVLMRDLSSFYLFFLNATSANLKKTEPACEAGEFLRPLTKCFSSTETSSNKADSFR